MGAWVGGSAGTGTILPVEMGGVGVGTSRDVVVGVATTGAFGGWTKGTVVGSGSSEVVRDGVATNGTVRIVGDDSGDTTTAGVGVLRGNSAGSVPIGRMGVGTGVAVFLNLSMKSSAVERTSSQ